jgi:hypothetical protein
MGWGRPVFEDMRDAPVTFPTPNGGHHPLWGLGHLQFAEGSIVNGLIKGEDNPYEELAPLFWQGTQPVADAEEYPSMDELFAKYDKARAETIALLDTMTDDDLDKPSHAPPEFGDGANTIGKCFAMLIMHAAFHGGQVADTRRAAGRQPLMG